MFNSLLNAVGIDSLILDIFIILGVVVAGALIVYFLWEAVASIVNKNKKDENDMPVFEEKATKKNVAVSNFSLADEKTEEQPIVLVDDNKLEDVDEVKAEKEQAEEEQEINDRNKENEERRAYLEARRQELIKRMQAEISANDETDESDEAEEQDDVVEEKEPVEEESKSEVEEQEISEDVETAQISEQNVETASVENNSLEEERKALEEEKARYTQMIKELADVKQTLMEQNKNVSESVPVNVEASIPVEYSLEELKEKLATAEERLRSTEKEFKQCKKEYIPLKKVWSAHEKDEKKLRRKEALVAKQKVLLYGVNNYAEIDEEKAKKLAEDLDLLDGLKLSVQHCEEVMKKNEERYPLLEKMYNVLKLRNDELKNDIAKYRAEIEKIEAEQQEAE